MPILCTSRRFPTSPITWWSFQFGQPLFLLPLPILTQFPNLFNNSEFLHLVCLLLLLWNEVCNLSLKCPSIFPFPLRFQHIRRITYQPSSSELVHRFHRWIKTPPSSDSRAGGTLFRWLHHLFELPSSKNSVLIPHVLFGCSWGYPISFSTQTTVLSKTSFSFVHGSHT